MPRLGSAQNFVDSSYFFALKVSPRDLCQVLKKVRTNTPPQPSVFQSSHDVDEVFD